MSKPGNSPADPAQKLKDENETMKMENIEHIISKEQAFQRM